MESILCVLLGAIITMLGMYVRYSLSRPKLREDIDILKNEERRALCRILNKRKDILVRYKNCETSTYYAHIVTHKDTNEYIIIDLDE